MILSELFIVALIVTNIVAALAYWYIPYEIWHIQRGNDIDDGFMLLLLMLSFMFIMTGFHHIAVIECAISHTLSTYQLVIDIAVTAVGVTAGYVLRSERNSIRNHITKYFSKLQGSKEITSKDNSIR